LHVRLELEVDEVADLKRAFLVMLVGLLLHAVLGAEKMLSEKSRHRLAFTKPVVEVWDSASRGRRNPKMAWRMAVESFKRGASQRRVVRSIVPELSKWKPAKPLRGTGVYRAPEKSFKALVEAFSLAVGLGMVGRAHKKLGVCQTEQLLP
jgi:hypothetical protein